MADSIEKIVEVTLKTGIAAGLTDDGLTASQRSELIDDDAGETTEAKSLPAIITRPAVAVPNGYLENPHRLPIVITIITHAADDKKKLDRLALFESVINTLKTRAKADWQTGMTAGTFDAVEVEGGDFRTEENTHLVEINTTWTICTA